MDRRDPLVYTMLQKVSREARNKILAQMNTKDSG